MISFVTLKQKSVALDNFDVLEQRIVVDADLCCGCCDMFVGLTLISIWNYFWSLPFFVFGGIYIIDL